MSDKLTTKIEFLKGVGPQKAELLNKELALFIFEDLLHHFPFRYEDRSQFYRIADLHDGLQLVQIKGKLQPFKQMGQKWSKRLISALKDDSGRIELVWFKGANWIKDKLVPGAEYVVFGKPTKFGSKLNIAHPEIELLTQRKENGGSQLVPVYPTTEKLRKKYLDSKGIIKLTHTLIHNLTETDITETLPSELRANYKLISRLEAYKNIHFPKDNKLLSYALFRLKFEELLYTQLRLLKLKSVRIEQYDGPIFKDTSLLTTFYNDHLPFELTNAQKKVIKEVYRDLCSGKQMNRLLQGDVGSGKTIVAFICMLLAIGHDAQAALIAPTEILAQQHYQGLKKFADALKLRVALLTGSTKAKERKLLLSYLRSGDIHILIGTHALLEERVKFKNLGLAVIDEQHRFGVAQRAKLWNKDQKILPHVLVMTATPIPRTLAMTLYGDLDVSVLDELPAGRKPIKTTHRFDSHRLKVFGFISEQIKLGRQVYVVYPLIEESDKMDYKDLMDGYESICRSFPGVPVSILHGRMKSEDKDFEMQRFVKNETKIMVATTVIEVGVNVPNATVMIIENAERFGLAQLHQLRGRVGRGAEQSYCILMSGVKLSKDGRTRLETLVRTNDGFEIADADLKLRGPGDIEGTQQSGLMDFKIADLAKDGQILSLAREAAKAILEEDETLQLPKYRNLNLELHKKSQGQVEWSRVS